MCTRSTGLPGERRKEGGRVRAARLQNETAPEKLLNRYEKRLEKDPKNDPKRDRIFVSTSQAA